MRISPRWTLAVAVCVAVACVPLTQGAREDAGSADATASDAMDPETLADARALDGSGGLDGGDAPTGPVDAANGGPDTGRDGAAPDASSGPCDWTKPFGAPRKVDGLSTLEFEDSARFSPDELTVYYQAQRPIAPGGAFFFATRATIDAGFSGETQIAGSSDSTYVKKGPSVTADGLTLFYFAFNGVSRWEVLASTRVSTAVPFDLSVSTPVAAVNTPSNDMYPYVAYDGALWFVSNRPTEFGPGDIFRAAMNGTSFDAPVRVTELSSPDDEHMPVLSADGRTIYFSSDRLALVATDGGVTGYHDIWMAHRSSVNGLFGAPVLLSQVSSGETDWPTWISPDECRLYISSGRDRLSLDIFVAERTR